MKCLCCGKEIVNEVNSYSWHNKCVRSFFNTQVFPIIDLNKETIQKIVEENTQSGYTVPGVQKKLSLHLISKDSPRLTIVNYPCGYILKPQTDEYKFLPEYEYLTMSMAKAVGIKVVPFALIKIDDEFAYITKRIDREKKEDKILQYAMEDFCQLDNRLTIDKYKGSYEKCGRIIKDNSSKFGLDLSELFLRIVFSFIVGNSDMHLKNFSLITSVSGGREYTLSPAYDMLPVNLILPEDKDELALTLNAKKSNIKRQDFILFAINIGLTEKIANNIIDSLLQKEDALLNLCDDSYLKKEKADAFKNLIKNRIARIKSISI